MILALWIAGLLAGMGLAHTGDTFFLTMRGTIGAVSIPGLFLVLYLPFLLAAFAILISRRWLILPILTLKAFSFGFLVHGLEFAYGDSSWLLGLLLMFSGIATVPVLLWFLCRRLRQGIAGFYRDAAVYAVYAAVIGSLDYLVISPFLASLICT